MTDSPTTPEREAVARIIDGRCIETLDRMLAEALPKNRAYIVEKWFGTDVLAKADAILARGCPEGWPEPDVEYEVWQGDEWCASSSLKHDAEHYMAVYGQDGPVRAKTAFTYRFDGHVAAPQPSGGE